MRLCPWADVVYGCDGPWWVAKNGLPDFKGIKLAHDTNVCATYGDVHKIEVEDHDLMLFDDPGVVGSGGNSGFQAVNLAAQFGARRILLIGFDMHEAAGVHWYGRNTWRKANNPSTRNFVRWRNAFADQAGVLLARGIEIINTSLESALTCFPQMTLEEAILRWERCSDGPEAGYGADAIPGHAGRDEKSIARRF